MLIYLFFAILCVIEARLEKITIAMKNPGLPDYAELNKQEHEWSAAYYFGVLLFTAGISYLFIAGNSWKFFPAVIAFLVIRRIFFEYALKIFRKRSIKTIEGDQWLDTWVRKLLGANGGYKELGLLVILLTVLIIIIQKL
jgi:hypothetical protein